MREYVPFSQPEIGDEEIGSVVDVLRSGWLTTGPRVRQFEEEFRAFVKTAHAIAISSCTAGLHLALAGLRIGHGDEVITTPLTFCATVNAILHAGATPVLVDIGPDLNIDTGKIRAAVTRRTRAILPVHFAGLPCEMTSIWSIAREHGLAVVEDAAHACGALYQGRQIGGGTSEAVAFSFYATKNLTTGEGGMVTTPLTELAERMRMLSLHGMTHDAWNRYGAAGSWAYEVVDLGFKYNMSDIAAALGVAQLRKLERFTEQRARIARTYDAAFGDLPELELPPDRADARHCWHLYVLRLRLDRLAIERAQFIAEMRARGVGCSVHFIPIPLHPYYQAALQTGRSCPRALSEYPRLVSLPIYPAMTGDDIAHVIDAVRDVVTSSRAQARIFVEAPVHS